MSADRGAGSAGPQRFSPAFGPPALGVLAAILVFFAIGLFEDGGGPSPSGEDGPEDRTEAVAGGGAAVFARMGCGGCHRLAVAGSEEGPALDLDRRVPRHTRESLAAAIVAPRTEAMPNDYGERLSAPELDALVTFLLEATR